MDDSLFSLLEGVGFLHELARAYHKLLDAICHYLNIHDCRSVTQACNSVVFKPSSVDSNWKENDTSSKVLDQSNHNQLDIMPRVWTGHIKGFRSESY